MKRKKKINSYEPVIGQPEWELLEDCIKTGWISSLGKYIPKFERSFAKFCGCSHAAAVMNGTAALHLALMALEIEKGDEVIVPALTYVATANSVAYAGAKVVLADVSNDTWTIDPDTLSDAITPRTKAILAVHLYGHPCNMDPILEIAHDRGIKVIEDAAEAHGSKYKGKRVGPLADVGCFSFYGNKVITTGEGGMVVTNDSDIDARIRLLRDHSMDPYSRYYHAEIGYNYRMTNMQAAVGCAQMKRIAGLISAKRKVAKMYARRLRDIEGITLPPEAEWAWNIYWLYTIVLDDSFGLSSEALAKRLEAAGVDTRRVFIPMHSLPMYSTRKRFPVSERVSQNGLSLPSSPTLPEDDIDYICDVIREARKKG